LKWLERICRSLKLPLDADCDTSKAEFQKSEHWGKTGTYVILRIWFQWVITWPELDHDWDMVACTLDWLDSQMKDWKGNEENEDNEELENLAVDDLQWEDIAAKIAGEDPADGDKPKLSGEEALSEMRRRTKNGLRLSYLCMIDDKNRHYGRMFHALGKCLHRDYKHACNQLDSQLSAMKFQADGANRSWRECLRSMARLAHDQDLCASRDISFDVNHGPADDYQREQCAFFWKNVLNFMMQRAWSMVYYSEVMNKKK